MYKATIKTKYNVITLDIQDTNDEQFKEVCEQPYVEEVRLEQIKTKDELIKERDELLNHCVGMTYNTQKAMKLTKKINHI